MSQAVYSNTTLSILDAISPNRQRFELLGLKTCPFCLAEPLTERAFHGRALVYCDQDNCPARPQVTGATLQDAAKLWNHRNHSGFVAREVG
jgi:hypothetical protein